MAITLRCGAYKDFDPNKLLTAELAIVLDGDPRASNGRSLYACFKPGDVKQIATYEDMVELMKAYLSDKSEQIAKEMARQFTEDLLSAIEGANNASETAYIAIENITELKSQIQEEESKRVSAETKRQQDSANAINGAENAAEAANAAAKAANTAVQNLNSNFFYVNLIPDNTDLNTIKTQGFYYSPSTTSANTMDNIPIKQAFFMIVGKHAGTYQEFITFLPEKPKKFFRNYYGYENTWGKWYEEYTEADPQPSVAKLTTPRTINGTAFDGTANIRTNDCYSFNFLSNGNTNPYCGFAYMPTAVNRGQISVLISGLGNYANGAIGQYIVTCSTRGGPKMIVTELIHPEDWNGLEFGYWPSGDGYMFGFKRTKYSYQTYITNLGSNFAASNSNVTDTINLGVLYNSTDMPRGWTIVTERNFYSKNEIDGKYVSKIFAGKLFRSLTDKDYKFSWKKLDTIGFDNEPDNYGERFYRWVLVKDYGLNATSIPIDGYDEYLPANVPNSAGDSLALSNWNIDLPEEAECAFKFFAKYGSYTITLDGNNIISEKTNGNTPITISKTLSKGTHTLIARCSKGNAWGTAAGDIDSVRLYIKSPVHLSVGGREVRYQEVNDHSYALAKNIGVTAQEFSLEPKHAYLLIVSTRNADTGAVRGSTARLIITPGKDDTSNVTLLSLGTTTNTDFTITAGKFAVSVKGTATYAADANIYQVS